jgi:hypothetical protein
VNQRFWLVLWTLGATLTVTGWAMDPMAPPQAETLASPGAPATEPALKTGPVAWHAGITSGVTHDNNIELSQTNREVAYVTTISPELTANMGNLKDGGGTGLSLDYRPTFFIFSDYTDNNTVDQYANLLAQWVGAKLTLGVGQTYALTHGAVVEIGQRVRQDTYNTDLLAKYAFSEKTSLEVAPRLTIQDSDQYIDTQEWGVDTFLNHQLSSKVTGGIGGSVGYFGVQNSADQRYVRGLARVIYELGSKVSVTAAGGVEYREYTGSEPSTTTPVFGVAGTYRPFEKTTVMLEAHRREEAAVYTNDQNYVTMGFSAEVRQQLWQQYFVSVTGGYDNRYYSSTQSGAAANRTDNYFFVRPSAGAIFGRNWSITIFYQYQADDSTAATYSFVNSQAGVEGSWRY